MPNEFHHHPDGFIYVRTTSGGVYGDTVAHFTTDNGGAAPPALPAGANEQIYTVGVRHAYVGNGNIIKGGPLPYPWADDVIGRIGALLSAQAAREAATPGPTPPPGTTMTAAEAKEAALRAASSAGSSFRPPSGPNIKHE